MYLLKNFAEGTLSLGIGTSDTSIIVNSGHTLPVIAGTFVVIIWNPHLAISPANDPNMEIVECGYSGGSVFTISRAKESTVAKNHPAGSKLSMAFTAGVIEQFQAEVPTFVDSLVNIGGEASLVNDAASPGASKYYGTDAGGTKGYFSVSGGDMKYADSRFFIGSFTRALNAANGDVAYNGIGFTPKAVCFFAVNTIFTSQTKGWDTQTACFYAGQYVIGSTITWIGSGTRSIKVVKTDDPNTYQEGHIKSMDADGFTITWEKGAGSGAQNGTIYFIAYR